MATGTSTSNSNPELNDELEAAVGADPVVDVVGGAEVENAAENATGQEEAAEEAVPKRRFLLFNAVPSWMISMAVHVVLLLILALMYI